MKLFRIFGGKSGTKSTLNAFLNFLEDTAEEVGQIINIFFVDCSVIDAKKVVAVGIHSSKLHKGEDWLPVIGQ